MQATVELTVLARAVRIVSTMLRAFESVRSMFWPLQIGGWTLYGLANLVGSIPYLHIEPHIVAYRTAFLIVGFLASFLLHRCCRYLWVAAKPLAYTTCACIFFCYVFGLAMSAGASAVEVFSGGSSVDLGWPSVLAAAAGGTFVQVAWSASYFAVKLYAAREASRTDLLKAEASARSAQLEALRYQLQPHFLFNTLNAISTLVVTEQADLAAEMIEKLADVLRGSLERPGIHTVPLQEEIASTKAYLAIEQVRFGSRLDVAYDIEDQAGQLEVPRFILQPIIENAIQHGISRSPQGGSVIIRAYRGDEKLTIIVKSPRLERDKDPVLGHGVGLSNTRRRLAALYGSQGVLSVTQGLDSVAASISIPLPPCIEVPL